MNVDKPKICVISFSDLGNDPRVRKQLLALKDRYHVTALGLKKSGISGLSEFVIPDFRNFFGKTASRIIFLLSRLFKRLYNLYINKKYPIKKVINILKDSHFDLIVANELDSLVLAHSITRRNGAKILFDAHEYEPKRIEDHWFHRLFVNPYKDFLCKKYFPFVDAVTTVSYGIAEEYNREFGINPKVIMNTPPYKKAVRKKIDTNRIAIVHIGVAHPSRKIEEMLKILNLLDEKFSLTLILVVKNKGYFKKLVMIGDKICQGRVVFSSPVPFDEILVELSKYDMGLVFYKPTSFNIKHSLPNKFFEYIMAGLALVIGPSPEMKRVTDEFNCGFVASSFNIEDMAKMINSLTIKDITEKKMASLKAAKILNAEKEMQKFKTLVAEMLET